MSGSSCRRRSCSRRDRRPHIPAAELSGWGLRVGLQSDAEEGARTLPLMGLYAVELGMGRRRRAAGADQRCGEYVQT